MANKPGRSEPAATRAVASAHNFLDHLAKSSFLTPDRIVHSAWLTHAPFAFWLIEVLKPTIFVELGTHAGFSYLTFCQAIQRLGLSTTCFAIDTWRGDEHGGFYGPEVLEDLRAYHDPRYSGFSSLIESTFDDAVGHFLDASIDLLHIDGFHTYESVKHDFELWKPKLSRKGIVLFHDTNVRESNFGVFKLWDELKKDYPSFEFMHGHGLGVLGVGDQLPDSIGKLFTATRDPAASKVTREAYSRLGSAVEYRAALARLEDEFALTRKLHSAQVERYESEATSLRASVGRLDDALQKQSTDAAHLAAKLESTQERLRGLELLAEKNIAEASRISGDLGAARARIEALQTTLTAQTAEVANRDRDLASAKERIEALNTGYAIKSVEAASRDRDLASAKERIEALNTAYVNRSVELASRDRDLASAKERIEALNTAYVNRSAEVVTRDRDLAFARGRVSELESHLEQSRSTQTKFDRDLRTLRDRLSELTWTLKIRDKELHEIRTNSRRRSLAALLHRGIRRSWMARQIKRVIKLIWWTITLRLVSELRRVVRNRRSARVISSSGLFNGAWYVARYPDVRDAGVDPLAHYLLHGAAEGRNPDPLFDSDWYLDRNPDVQKVGINPLAHYLLHGAQEGRNPNPLFDSGWYLHQNPDVRDTGVNPLAHYLRYGESEGRNPSPMFNNGWYLAANPDVRLAGASPLAHYLEFGEAEGRPLPAPRVGANSAPARRLPASYDVIVLANIEWQARYQRPQQLATQFARNGHRVFYAVASPTIPDNPRCKYDAVEVAENVIQLQFSRSCLFDRYATSLSGSALDTFVSAFGDLVEDYRIVDAVVHVHLPSWSMLALALREKWLWPIIYDCMDDWDGFPGLGSEVVAAERSLVAAADLVTVTGALLEEKWGASARRCEVVRNGVDFSFFQSRCVPNTRFSFAKPVIGYYGALADWVDLDLIAKLATQNPHWQFVLAGDVFVRDLHGLDAKRNVTLLGLRPYEDMPPLLWHFDVCLIPFKLNAITHSVDPVKLYEYLSGGKPIVSAPLDELQIYRDVVAFADGPDEFAREIAKALTGDGPDRDAARRTVAAQNRWSDRYVSLETMTLKLFPFVSIIIVTHNNADLTKMCIDSILANTTHPCYEVIIVDNASSDNTRDFLATIRGGHSNIRLILNDENRGFAAANNQGLRMARGEVLVLMNNDVVVPRGWLRGVLHCLADPHVGLAGPVTNFVGNEARIEVSYRDLSDMEAFAHAHMRDHGGHTFDIRVLAMYCLAMRRDVFSKVGFLDEAFGIGMFEDDDYCNRVRVAGYRIVCTEASFVHHFGQASFKKLIENGEYEALWARNKAHYESKWGAWKPHALRGGASLAAG